MQQHVFVSLIWFKMVLDDFKCSKRQYIQSEGVQVQFNVLQSIATFKIIFSKIHQSNNCNHYIVFLSERVNVTQYLSNCMNPVHPVQQMSVPHVVKNLPILSSQIIN